MILSVLLYLGFLLLLTAFAIIIVLYLYFLYSFKHWAKRNIPHDEPSFPFGSFKNVGKRNITEIIKNIYDSKRNLKYFGAWFSFKPHLFVNDPDLIKRILVKDFSSFHDRGLYYHKEVDPLSANLVTLEGEEWKQLRKKLSFAFSLNKIKMMLPSVIGCSFEMVDLLRKSAEMNGTVDMKDIASRFTTDVISCCCFGLEGGSLKDPKSKMRLMGQKMFKPSIFRLISNLMQIYVPNLARKVRMRVNSKEVVDFFMNTFRQLLGYREANNIIKNDLFQSLMELKNEGFNDDALSNNKLSFEQLAAEAFVFFVGGIETSSITIQYALYELSLNQSIQEEAREEIKRVLSNYDGKITYEAIYEMKYLGQIIDETLRKYPPTGGLVRSATKAYNIPETDHVIEKGTAVVIQALGIQRDERYYLNPEKFYPDRFSDEEKASRHPCVFLTFGEGPRRCIGKTFALMEFRVALIALLQNFKFDLPGIDDRERRKESNPKSVFLAPKNMKLKISLVDG